MSMQTGPGVPQPVVITDVDISFGRLVVFFFKAGLAAIPAAIAVSIVMAVVMAALGAIFGGPWWHRGMPL
jgi:hypothetical protein